MKAAAIATLLFTAISFNAAADEPYQHEYLNGGYFEGQAEAPAIVQQEKAYKHEYLNGGHFEAALDASSGDTLAASKEDNSAH